LNSTEADSPVEVLETPEGFQAIRVGGPFMAHNGPLYARWTGDRVLLGFRVLMQHTNPMKICHGGMLASFADMLLPCVANYQHTIMERRFLPTISLNIDYLASAPLGAWVQGQGEVLRSTRNMLFAQGLITADGVPAVRVSGIFKMGPVMGDGKSKDPFGLFAARS